MDAEAAMVPVHKLLDELLAYPIFTLEHGQDFSTEDRFQFLLGHILNGRAA
jgi:hypothetical protein